MPKRKGWYVGSEQDGDPTMAGAAEAILRCASEHECEEVIACLEIMDPEGVHEGLYSINPPEGTCDLAPRIERNAMKLKCPNCTKPVAQSNAGCLLHDLMQVARERANVSERKLRTMHAKVDADALWNALGPIVDDLEEGRYS